MRAPTHALALACFARLVILVLALACFTGSALSADPADQRPRNIIILMADGAAPTQWDFAKRSSTVLRGEPFATTDVVFRDGVLGLLSTYPYDSYVVDSAAAASAMSTGYKAAIGAIAITPDGTPRTTVMQAARAAGKRVGLVTTAAVYDATPAAFTVNVKSRRESQLIVDLLYAFEPDVLMGGGADYFLPATARGGKRKDGRDVIAAFRAKGYAIAGNTAELSAAKGAKLLGLFATEEMAFELDRDPAKEPTTGEMAVVALRMLSQQSPDGFVLLVENENVDTAGHANDAASLMRALWAFDDAVKVALDFQRRHPDTLVIVTGDHESGGFSPTYALRDLGAPETFFSPGAEQFRMLERITMSFGRVRETLGAKPSAETLDALLVRHFPGFRLDPDLREQLLKRQAVERNFFYLPQNFLGHMVARRTGFYWGTAGHTPEPVAVGAIGPGAHLFRGYQDNTDFGKHLHRLLGR